MRSAVKVAIMQPYFFPYIGYFQLIHAVDLFIVYDNIKYTKKGWINRNRILRHGKEAFFTLPLKGDSDSLDVRDRELAAALDRDTLLGQITEASRRAPHFEQAFPVVEQAIRHDDRNLFGFLYHSLATVCRYLGIRTPFSISSGIPIDHSLRGQDRVLALCEAAGASVYVNPIGGTELYSRPAFGARNIELKFLKSGPFEYRQLGDAFVPWLSIIDVMMFNPVQAIGECLASNYELT